MDTLRFIIRHLAFETVENEFSETPIRASSNISNIFEEILSSGSLPVKFSPSYIIATFTGVTKSPSGVKSLPDAMSTKIYNRFWAMAVNINTSTDFIQEILYIRPKKELCKIFVSF